MIHFDTTHRILVVCILLFGVALLYITWCTNAFINQEQLQSLPKREIAKAVPLWVGLITALAWPASGSRSTLYLSGRASSDDYR
jgi:hypothetical protein